MIYEPLHILYAIQGTGNGHLSRAMAMVPLLRQRGQVDVLLSGTQADLELPFEVKYHFQGLSFVFGKKGGIDFADTWKRNNARSVMREIRSLPVRDYDIIISDFEPISAWACKLRNKPCIGFGNQYAVLSKYAPQPEQSDWMGKLILRHYAPVAARYGIHFSRYEQGIYTPIIRPEVRSLSWSNEGHYVVYLPAYSDTRIIKSLQRHKQIRWMVFSKHAEKDYQEGNVQIRKINGPAFLKSIASSAGVLCAAGFGTTSEALFLGKKLLVIPQKRQIEQYYNAAALADLGVPVMKSLKKKHQKVIRKWIKSTDRITVTYPEVANSIVSDIIADYYTVNDPYTNYLTQGQFVTQ